MKKRAKKIFDALRKLGFHPTDIEYLNGYFIFEYGKDTVVHFHLKECKGWKFGIWWRELDKDKQDKTYKLQYDFFAQFEKNIDKFKPAASTFVEEDIWFAEKGDDALGYDMEPICKFIKNHPLKAWDADRTYKHDIWNTPSHFLLWKFLKERWLNDYYYSWLRNRADKKFLKLLTAICEEALVDYKIVDENRDGIISCPRWSVFAKNFKENPVDTRGWYPIEPDDVPTELWEKAKKFDDKEQNSRRGDIYRDCDFLTSMGVFINDKKLKERKREKK